MNVDKTLRRVRWAVRCTLTLGVAASVAANILHAQHNPVSRAISAWPPLALLLTVELISRVPVHRRSLAIVRLVATATIATIAAWVSYWHMVGVTARYGETDASPYLIPLSVDGLIVVASICLVELAGRIRDLDTPTTAVLAAPATVDTPGMPDALATVEVPAATRPRTPRKTAPAKTTPAQKTTPAKKATTAKKPAPDSMATPAVAPPPALATASAPATVDTSTPAAPAPSADIAPLPVHLLPTVRFAITNHEQSTGRAITPGELAARMSIPTDTARRLLLALTDTTTIDSRELQRVNGSTVLETSR